MGAPVRSSSDIPDFSTYPSSPSDQLLSAHESNAELDRVARKVGIALGEGAVVIRDLRERAMDRIQSLRDSADELAMNARERASDVAQESFDRLREESRAQIKRAKQFANARPLAVIAAAGIAGVLIGMGARAWRENRG